MHAREIFVGHGIHPGEPGMKELYAVWTGLSLPHVTHGILSPTDWELDRRLYEGQDNLAYIHSDMHGTPGQRFLAHYIQQIVADGYDLVIHPHGNINSGGEAVLYGPQASSLTKRAATYLGYDRALIVPTGVEAELPHVMGLEVVPNSQKLGARHLAVKLGELAAGAELPKTIPEEYGYIAFIKNETAKRLGMRERYGPFAPLADDDACHVRELIGADPSVEIVAYCWDAMLYEKFGYWGELVARWPLHTSLPAVPADV